MKTKDKAREGFIGSILEIAEALQVDNGELTAAEQYDLGEGIYTACNQYQAATEANKEALREVLEALENTDYHHDLFMQVNDCKDFCQEERLMQLGNLLQACEDQNKAIATLKQMMEG